MKNNNDKKIIIIISIILVILIILLITINIIVKSKRKKTEIINQVSQYTSINEFKTIEEVSEYLGCNLKKQEKSKNKNYIFDIYMEIKLLPYTENVSNEIFYNKLIQYSASALKYQDFRIIDLKNDIVIEVLCNKDNKMVKNFIINDEKNYFAKHDSIKEINNMQELIETKMDIQAKELKKLINNNWRNLSSDIGLKDGTFEKYDIYFDNGIEVREIENKVFNIIFTEKYKGNIINNITTNTSREEIIKILGEPTFKDEYTKCIGYKGKDIYFFYNSKKEISVYRVEKDFDSTELAKIVDSYLENNDETKLIQDVKEKYKDYDKFEDNSKGTILKYSLKGICFRFQKGLSRGIQIYNNYFGTIYKDINLNKLKESEFLPDNIYIYNENLVAECEYERISNINKMILTEDIEKNKNQFLSYSNKFYTIKEQQGENSFNIKFISKDNENPNVELREIIDYYIWADDYNFIYSIKNKGIYIFNLKSRKYSKIEESKNEEFKIIEYKDNILKYDEKSVKLKSK